jgi:hypothetical protein
VSLKQTVNRAVLAKWMQDRIKGIRDELGRDAKDAMDAGDRKKAVLEDGTVIGSVTITDPKWRPQVTNPAALQEWVQENRPTEMWTPPAPTPAIRSSYLDALLKRVQQAVGPDGATLQAVDPDTGELIPGIEFERRPSNATVTVTPEQADAIETALQDGRLDMRSLTTHIEPKELET